MKQRLFKLFGAHFKAFSLHSLTGLMAVIAHYGVMFTIIQIGGVATYGTFIGFFFGALIKYYYSHTKIFPNNREHRDALQRFILALVAQALINLGLFNLFSMMYFPSLLTQLISSTWIAQVLATGVLTVLNYIVYRYWVFSDKPDSVKPN